MKRSRDTAAALIRLAGIWLLANAVPVFGSISVSPVPEKSPARIASVGTVAYWSNRLFE